MKTHIASQSSIVYTEIITHGLIFPQTNAFKVPFSQINLFTFLLNGVGVLKPVIIHGPFQSKKTWFLYAAQAELLRRGISAPLINMEDSRDFLQSHGDDRAL